ncbi:DUF1566 domain-containing protein [bacterium]|nr:DUF1566 domain-containing protein [bacterium]
MKRFFIIVLVFALVFAVAACSKKKSKEKPEFEEQVSQEVSAEEGGKVESKDGKTSIDIPAGALDSDTTITMTIYDASGYAGTDGKKVISKVVEFGPNGTIFKKPVLITMENGENIENKIITAAVYNEAKGEWSYSETGVAVKVGKDAAGDPIMTSAAGDPIMLNAAGDPIMQNAAGDPIMMSAAGDPIMATAAGDPIMNAAAGDPIMMTTGHFTAFTFIAVEKKGDGDKPDEDPVDDSDEDVIPEPEPLYSKVICTGLRNCFGENGVLDECPKEGGALNGQDAGYIFRKSCVPKSFEKIEKAENDVTPYQQIKDNNTGLTWILTSESGESYDDIAPYCEETLSEYAGGGWRMPTPAEFLTIADHDIFNNLNSGKEIKSVYFTVDWEGTESFWTSDKNFYYDTYTGSIGSDGQSDYKALLCVKGDKYGEVAASDYTSKNENGQEMIFDSKTNLFWQKTSVSGKTWPEALAYCEGLNYAGHDDWRLPNKNELASLVDYSKSNPASSFPGLPAENFVTSTFTMTIGAVAIDMKTGEMGLRMSDHPQVKSRTRGINSGETYSVICVRSDLTPYPENGIPACGADGYSPCRDANNITWSQRLIYNEYEMESVHWSNVAKDCRNMKGGKWRIPTIDDVRSLFTDDVFKTGGTCGVTVEHSDYSAYESDCTSAELAGHETALRDYGILFSGTFSNANADYERDQWNVWTIDMTTGGMSDISTVYAPQLVVRCVLDNTLEDPKEAPYTDETNGLVWSSISEEGDWRDAVEYCGTLVEGGSDNWRVPTLEELQKLVRNCDLEGTSACAPDLTGKYSLFSDMPILLSSDIFDGSYMTTLDFIDLMTDQNKNLSDSYADLQVRCVRSVSDPLEDPDNFEGTLPYYVEDMAWSKKSELITGTIADAEAFCNSLNEEEYEGSSEWRLPDVWSYLYLLVEEDMDCSGACSEEVILSEGETARCFCDYTFKSHSIFNDYGKFWTSDRNEGEDEWGSKSIYPYLFDFTTGEVVGGSNESWGYENSGYVRCVRYIEE